MRSELPEALPEALQHAEHGVAHRVLIGPEPVLGQQGREEGGGDVRRDRACEDDDAAGVPASRESADDDSHEAARDNRHGAGRRR